MFDLFSAVALASVIATGIVLIGVAYLARGLSYLAGVLSDRAVKPPPKPLAPTKAPFKLDDGRLSVWQLAAFSSSGIFLMVAIWFLIAGYDREELIAGNDPEKLALPNLLGFIIFFALAGLGVGGHLMWSLFLRKRG